MSARLSKRERNLAILVGAVVVILINLFLISFFLDNQRRLGSQLKQKRGDLAAMQLLFADKDLWAQRDRWLQQSQPKLVNEGTAGGQLLDEIKEVARKTKVQPLDPQIGNAEPRLSYVSVPVTIETRSSLVALRDFLFEMQSPERFIVFENVNLQTDPEDKTQMHGKFRIAKWFAPK